MVSENESLIALLLPLLHFIHAFSNIFNIIYCSIVLCGLKRIVEGSLDRRCQFCDGPSQRERRRVVDGHRCQLLQAWQPPLCLSSVPLHIAGPAAVEPRCPCTCHMTTHMIST